ncbi:lytic transglycosylase domain-containing protein [Candidatus Kaiserbacteria bacterium]|nr:lytic transglycosylase domain-containing protein [Candidatus Kaiserbacteria bacterium]
MEGPKKRESKFEVIPDSDFGYGPSIRRVEESDEVEVDDFSPEYRISKEIEPEPGDLNEEQRGGPRAVLRGMGFTVKSRKFDESRRNFLRGGATLAAGAALLKMTGSLPKKAGGHMEDSDFGRAVEGDISSSFSEAEMIAQPESVDSFEGGTRFEIELQSLREYVSMPKDTILFIDENGLPVGGPVKFQDYIGPKYRSDGSLYMEKYRFTPGKEINEIGIPAQGIAPEWIDAVEQIQERKYPEQKIVNKLHVTGEFMSGYRRADADLRDRVKAGEIQSLAELVDYFGDQAVEEEPSLSRKEYLQERVEFADFVPQVVQDEVRRLLPALSAKESKFSDTAVSSSGALGALQFKPDTWKDLGADVNNITAFTEQVKMMGVFTSRQYRALFHFVGKDRLLGLQEKFDDEDSYYRDLIVPLLINAHNTGAKGMADVVSAYLDAIPSDEVPTGKDLYIAIADFGKNNKVGGYGDEARGYAMMIYAYADEMKG